MGKLNFLDWEAKWERADRWWTVKAGRCLYRLLEINSTVVELIKDAASRQPIKRQREREESRCSSNVDRSFKFSSEAHRASYLCICRATDACKSRHVRTGTPVGSFPAPSDDDHSAAWRGRLCVTIGPLCLSALPPSFHIDPRPQSKCAPCFSLWMPPARADRSRRRYVHVHHHCDNFFVVRRPPPTRSTICS